MRDAIFILFVALILLGITAIKYRKQIAGMIGVARMLKEAAQPRGRSVPGDTGKSIPLVNCTKCGVWVPQNKARKVGDLFFCSDECVRIQKTV